MSQNSTDYDRSPEMEDSPPWQRDHFTQEPLSNNFYHTGCINDDLRPKDWRRMYNKTVLLYSTKKNFTGEFCQSGNWIRRWRRDIWDEWLQHGREPIQNDRFLYQQTFYLYPSRPILEDLDDFIRKHLRLCDELEDRIPEMEGAKKAAYFWGDPPCIRWPEEKYNDQIMVLPTCRAVVMLREMSENPPIEHTVALVLTGDNKAMQSGPVTFESIRDNIIPNECRDPRVAFVSLAVAVKFLRDLEDREIAVNREWQEHNRRCREKFAQDSQRK